MSGWKNLSSFESRYLEYSVHLLFFAIYCTLRKLSSSIVKMFLKFSKCGKNVLETNIEFYQVKLH